MSALGMGGPPSPAGIPPSITIGGPGPSDDATKSDGDWEQDLQAALAALRELAGDATDHVETNVVDTCIKALSGLLAKRQSGAEAALGVNAGHKAMSRAYGA
jgi:hypothetical protein